MKSILLISFILLTACSSKRKTLTTMTSEDILVIGRAINIHQGEALPVTIVYRTEDKNRFGGNPKADENSNFYFTAIIDRRSEKFAVKEIRMKGDGYDLSWGNTLKNSLAEVMIHPDNRAIYVGDIIMRTRNLAEVEEVTDFKIMDRSAEAKLFAIQTLQFNGPITKALLKITLK